MSDLALRELNSLWKGATHMNEKQRYYASLERQRAAETSLSNPSVSIPDTSMLDALYTDMGMRAFAAFQNCLDWLGSIGHKQTQLSCKEGDLLVDRTIADNLQEISATLNELKEQLTTLEGSMSNLESGMRRIDKYTLDAFRQLAELDTARIAGAQQDLIDTQPGNRRLAKEEAMSLAIEAAKEMAKAGQSLSLAAVARRAGLKYGQIVYAFGNKETFMARLQAIQESESASKPTHQTEVAATGEREAAS
jgi:hypothetical protein